MSETDAKEKAPRWWRILRVALPLLFLLSGFFGIQIWMTLDEQRTAGEEKPVQLPIEANSAKAQVAKLAAGGEGAAGSEAGSAEVPVSAPPGPGGSVASEEQALSAQYPEVVCYRIQAGSFKDPAGAEKLRKKLGEAGYGSMALTAGGNTDVFLMVFFSREQAGTVAKAVAADGVAAVAEKAVHPARMILLQGGSARLQSFMDGSLAELPELLRELGDYYYLYESQGFAPEDHGKLVLRQQSRLTDMRSAVTNMTVAEDDKKVQTALTGFIADYLSYLETVSGQKTFKRAVFWPGLIRLTESLGTLGV